jgi:long-chain acyl-CoA synthetase
MLGYYNAPELTAEVKRNGWLHTGDIGYINDRGFLIITGRKKNVIIRGNGKNVFPEELEAYLCRNPFVSEAVVLAMTNDNKKECDIVAVLRPDEDYAKETLGADYTENALNEKLNDAIRQVNDVVQTYKRIDVVLWLKEEFPKNSSRKIKRFEIPNLIREQYLAQIQ